MEKKNKWNGMAKWAVIAATALIALGGMITTLNNHGDRLNKAEPKIEECVHAIISMQSDITYIKAGVQSLVDKDDP